MNAPEPRNADVPVQPLRFTVARDDYVEATLACWARDPSVRKQLTGIWGKRIAAIGTPLVLLAITLYVLKSFGKASYELAWWEIGIAVALIVLVIQHGALALEWIRFRPVKSLRAQAQEVAAQAISGYDLGDQSIELAPGYFIWTSRHERIEQRWTGIARIMVESDVLVIERRDRRCFIVPQRQVGDEAFRSLASAARAALASESTGPDRIVEQYLKLYPTPCPSCNYVLTGIKTAECPECGVNLNKSNLAQAWMHAVELMP